MATSNQTLAIQYAQHGCVIFPCRHEDSQDGKAKAPLTANGFLDAKSDIATVKAWWQRWYPHALIGLPCNQNKLVAIDCDCHPVPPGSDRPFVDGVTNFQGWCKEKGIDLTGALIVETPSGGLHIIFYSEKPFSNSDNLLPDGVEVRGNGYIIAPGSVYPDGRTYRVISGSWETITPVPEALLPFLKVLGDKGADAPPHSSGERQAASAYEIATAAKVLRESVAKLAATADGGRNTALNNFALPLGEMISAGWIEKATVEAALMDAMQANGYIAESGRDAAWNTLQSGLTAGMKQPRPPLPKPENVPFQNQSASASSGEVEVKRMFEFEAKPIQWSWKHYLPKGCLTLIAGPGGSGKSTVALNLAATTTNCGNWPDGSKCEIAENVLLWSSEDDAETILVPRLMAMGANPNKVGIISTVKTAQGRLPFDPARDIEGLKKAVRAIENVGLIVIDPIVNCITGDAHRANDVRRNLSPIVELARELGCAVIGITHFAKGSEKRVPSERVLGSTAFTDFARMVLTCMKDEKSARCVFTRIKTNIAPLGGGFEYRLERKEVAKGIEAQYVEWDEPLEGSARDILATVSHDEASGGTKQEDTIKDAVELIGVWLQGGVEVLSEDLRLKAIQHQITEYAYRKALKWLGVVPYRQRIKDGKWVCRLPLKTTTGTVQ